MGKHAVILVGGSDSKIQGEFRSQVASCLEEHQLLKSSMVVPLTGIGTLAAVRVQGILHEKEETFDLFEVFWQDKISTFETMAPFSKLWRGTAICFRWLFSGVWKNIKKDKFLAFWTILISTVLPFWFVGFVLALMGSILSMDWVETILGKSGIATVDYLLSCAQALPVLLVVAALLKQFRFSEFLEIANEMYELLESESLKSAIASQIKDTVEVVRSTDQDQKYETVSLVAFSAGTIPTLQYIAGSDEVEFKNIPVALMGTPAGFLQALSKDVDEIVGTIQKKSSLLIHDYFYRGDFLCSPLVLEGPNDHILQHEIQMNDTVFERIRLKSHQEYFKQSDVVRDAILGHNR